MKPTFFLGAALATAAFTACSTPPPAPGSYVKAPATKPEVAAAADFAIKARSQAEGGAALQLVKIAGAEQQVVAGMNYRLLLKVKQGKQVKDAEAVVWWQAWRTPNPYQLTSWEWK